MTYSELVDKAPAMHLRLRVSNCLPAILDAVTSSPKGSMPHDTDQDHLVVSNVVNGHHFARDQISQVKHTETPLKSTTISVNKLHGATLSSAVEEDEISRSYVVTPGTSLPRLGLNIMDVEARKSIDTNNNIALDSPAIEYRPEASSALPYGRYSNYTLLDAVLPDDGSRASFAEHGQSSISIIDARHPEEGSTAGYSAEKSHIEVKGTDTSAIDLELLPGFIVLSPTAAYGQKEDPENISIAGHLGHDVTEIGAQFQDYVDQDAAKLVLKNLRVLATAVAE